MKNFENSKKFNKIFIIYFAILLAFVGVRICSAYGLFDWLGNTIVADITITTIIQVGIMLILPLVLYLFMFKDKPKQMLSDFGFKKLNLKSVLICFAIGILTFFLNLFIANFFRILINYAGFNSGGSSSGPVYDTFPKFLVNVLSVAILPAICEEFVHRGLLVGGLSKTIGYKKAILISSLLFGLMHLNIQQFFYATILGVLMGFIAAMTRSIWPAVIIHFCNNFINTYLSFAETTGIFGGNFSTIISDFAQSNIILFFVVILIVIALCVVGIAWLIKKLFMHSGINNYNKVFENIENKIREGSDAEMTDEEVVSTFKKYVFPNMKSPNNIIDFFIADNGVYNPIQFKYKIGMYACIFMGSIITVFTFIWGCI